MGRDVSTTWFRQNRNTQAYKSEGQQRLLFYEFTFHTYAVIAAYSIKQEARRRRKVLLEHSHI